jgi:hypothetical protein
MRLTCATTVQNRQVPLRVTRLWTPILSTLSRRFNCKRVYNCLFYRVNDVETTFIVLFVDDTLIFGKRQEDIYQFSARLNRHYELTLDAKADSFLGIHIEHNDDGTVLLTQPKLLQKLFKEHSVSARPGRRHTRTDLRRHTMPQPSRNNHRSYQ